MVTLFSVSRDEAINFGNLLLFSDLIQITDSTYGFTFKDNDTEYCITVTNFFLWN